MCLTYKLLCHTNHTRHTKGHRFGALYCILYSRVLHDIDENNGNIIFGVKCYFFLESTLYSAFCMIQIKTTGTLSGVKLCFFSWNGNTDYSEKGGALREAGQSDY